MERKITKRDFFEALIAYFAGEDTKIELTADVVNKFANREIENLDKKAEAAKRAAEKRKEKGDVLADLVLEALTDEFAPIAEITAIVAEQDETVTPQKVTYRLGKFVREGIVEKQQITVEGVDGQKARKVQGYRIV